MNIHYHNVSTRAQEHKEINQCNTGGRKCPFLYELLPSLSHSPDKIIFKQMKCLEYKMATFSNTITVHNLSGMGFTVWRDETGKSYKREKGVISCGECDHKVHDKAGPTSFKVECCSVANH